MGSLIIPLGWPVRVDSIANICNGYGNIGHDYEIYGLLPKKVSISEFMIFDCSLCELCPAPSTKSDEIPDEQGVSVCQFWTLAGKSVTANKTTMQQYDRWSCTNHFVLEFHPIGSLDRSNRPYGRFPLFGYTHPQKTTSLCYSCCQVDSELIWGRKKHDKYNGCVGWSYRKTV